MFRAVIISIATCFGYTSYHFYVFSGTNLLTRCHSASSLFSTVFGFRKSIKEIFSELDETKDIVNNITRRSRSPKGSRSRPTRGPRHTRARPRVGSRPLWRGGPPRPPTPPLRLYILRDAKTLLRSIIFHEKFRRGRHRQSQIGGVLKLFPAPCRRGDHHRRALHHHACLRSDA